MEEALGFFRAFEVWIYLLLLLAGLIYIRKFYSSWQELRGAGFGLERDNAQARLNQAASVIVLLISMAVAEFVLVSFIAPAVPGAEPLLTPTLSLLATPTITLGPESLQLGVQQVVSNTVVAPTPTSPAADNGCVSGKIEVDSPRTGQEVRGVVEVTGTAKIPNFGFYKIEMKRPDETVWLTIQAGNTITQSAKLGDWDTRRLSPGEYQLSLVVVDNQARSSLPCVVQVRVAATIETTPTP
jgi:hypothetical protein